MPSRPPPRPSPNATPLPRGVPGPPETPAPADRVPDQPAAEVPPAAAWLHSALRDARASIETLEVRVATYKEKITFLETTLSGVRIENGRLVAEARAQQGLRGRLEHDVEYHRDRARQAEATQRDVIAEMALQQRRTADAEARCAALEARLASGAGTVAGPQPDPQGLALGATEAFLDASGTLAGWLSALELEDQEVCIACYTFDLDQVVNACIGVKRRARLGAAGAQARVRILADEAHTEQMRNTGQVFSRAVQDGIEIRVGHGFPLSVAYPQSRADNVHMQTERGGHHAKVLFTAATRVAFIGSCNFTQSSQCNVELTARVALSPLGLMTLKRWYDDCWSSGVLHVISGGGRSGPSRSPTRPRSHGSRTRAWGGQPGP